MFFFDKPLKDILYDDVVIFCKHKKEENIYLDYKEDFPNPNEKLAKTISSFANTSGGIIIIGVKEDLNSKPKPPFQGIDFKQKLEDRITNIIINNINPPIFPEIRIVPPEKGKTFIIIYVEESSETPHRVVGKIGKSNAFIRTGSISKMIDFASDEQLSWLKSRRGKSIEFRQFLKERSINRKNNLYGNLYKENNFMELSMTFLPLFPNPDSQLIKKEKIGSKLFEVMSDRTSGEQYPYSFNNARPVQDGIYENIFNKTEKEYSYTEFSKFGLFYHCRNIQLYNGRRIVYLNSLFKILKNTFEIIHKFYDGIGFYGLVESSILLRRLKGAQVVPINQSVAFLISEKSHFKLDNDLKWHEVFSQIKLQDNMFFYNLLIRLFGEIAWSFGFKVEELSLTDFLGKI